MSNRSTFPTTIDTFIEHLDIQASDRVNVSRFQVLRTKSVLTPEEQTELTNLTTLLSDKIFSPEDLNKLQDAITNLETFFRDNVTGYISTKQTEMNAYTDTKKTEMFNYADTKKTEFDASVNRFAIRGTYSPTTQYYKWNYVLYLGNGFICKADTIDNSPVGDATDNYWFKTGVKGDKGDKGDQGLPGVGLNFRYAWDSLTIYNLDDLVTHDGSTWTCKNTISGETPSATSTNWEVFVARGGSTVLANYENRVMLGANSSNIPIGISQFNVAKDVLEVFKNGGKISKGIEFNIATDGSSIDKINDATGLTWTAGTIFDFAVTKNVSTDGSTQLDGTNLIQGSISSLKLDTSTQDKLTSVSEATSAPTANKIVKYGVNGRLKAADPSAVDDVTTKQYVDAQVALARTYAP